MRSLELETTTFKPSVLPSCAQVLGTVKDAALVTIGVVFLREVVSSLQLSGYLLSLVGFVAYNAIKAQGAQLPDPMLKAK